jgi:hypothetical protein
MYRLLYLVAEEASIEDTLYYLEKKILSGALDIDTFVKVELFFPSNM